MRAASLAALPALPCKLTRVLCWGGGHGNAFALPGRLLFNMGRGSRSRAAWDREGSSNERVGDRNGFVLHILGYFTVVNISAAFG